METIAVYSARGKYMLIRVCNDVREDGFNASQGDERTYHDITDTALKMEASIYPMPYGSLFSIKGSENLIILIPVPTDLNVVIV